MLSGKLAAGALILASGITAVHAAEVDAAKIAREGNSKGVTACLACHGPEGAGQPAAGFPRLAALNADYLAKQLRDFQSGMRNNPIMQPIAKALGDDEIAAISRYYAGLSVPAIPEPTPDLAQVKLGESLFKTGNWSKNVPACAQCHGETGQGVGAHFPAIAAQSSAYIRNQLRDWKNGSRHNDPVLLMKTVADHLSDAESAAVAAYLSSTGAK